MAQKWQKLRTFLENIPGAPPPPRNVTKLFTGLLQPTFQEGTGSFVSGGPYGPEGEPPPPRNVTKLFILDFNCQPLGRVPICFMSVGPYGPKGEPPLEM